jgi:serine/threonine-protein kinase
VDPAGSAGPATTNPPLVPANPLPTTTNGSRPLPTPSLTSAAPPAEPGLPISANGGTARVQCNGKKAQILRLDLTPGYTVDDYRPGPADEVKAVLVSATNKSEIKVKC